MPKYKVVIHYEGDLRYTIDADDIDEAEKIASDLFDSEDDHVFAEYLADSFITDSWRVE